MSDFDQKAKEWDKNQMHHIKDIHAIMGKFNRLLSPGGVLAIADLYMEDGSFHDEPVEVHPGFDPEELTLIMEGQGFKDIRFDNCFIIRKQVTSGSQKDYPVFLLTSCK